MFVNILNYKIFSGTKKELLELILKRKDKIHIVSGNPEVLYNGLKNNELFNNFTSKDAVIIPDGIGTVISSKLIGEPVTEKIAGIEVMNDLISISEASNLNVYFLGSTYEVLDVFLKNIKEKHINLKIAGSHDGFFDLNNCDDIIEEIHISKADVLFVAMGSPRQEIFIERCMKEIDTHIYMGVGGSFDVIAGKAKRAPEWMIKLGLEWLYRVGKEPWRFKRLSSIPKFIFKVYMSKFNKHD